MPQPEDSKNLAMNLPDSVWQILNEGNELGFRDSSESHPTFDDLVETIERTMVRARNVAARHVYNDQLLAYWNNGRMIVIYEQDGEDRAEYGDKTLVKLSKRLTEKMGRGFSRTNLQYMRLLYLKYPKCQTLS